MEEDEVCPLCCELMEESDHNFEPCPCGYQVRSYGGAHVGAIQPEPNDFSDPTCDRHFVASAYSRRRSACFAGSASVRWGTESVLPADRNTQMKLAFARRRKGALSTKAVAAVRASCTGPLVLPGAHGSLGALLLMFSRVRSPDDHSRGWRASALRRWALTCAATDPLRGFPAVCPRCRSARIDIIFAPRSLRSNPQKSAAGSRQGCHSAPAACEGWGEGRSRRDSGCSGQRPAAG